MTSLHLRVPGLLEFRDVAVRTVAAACNLVAGQRTNPVDPAALEVRSEFAIKVVSSFSEIFNNVVKHAYAGEIDGVIDIRIEIHGPLLRLLIEDHGRPFVLDDAPPLPATPQESGRGLFIVRAFVDDMSYSPGPPNTWTLEIKQSSAA
jgi:anti-sigma regulatory factor (Ser/Thr protein kinase)